MTSHPFAFLARSIRRHPLYATLNVAGLGIGFAVFIVLAMVVRYKYRFDLWLPNADKIFRLDSTYFASGQAPQEAGYATFVALPLLLQDYPQIAGGSRIMEHADPVSAGTIIVSEKVSYVDPNFLKIIELPILEGDRNSALTSSQAVVLTETMAQRFFATTHAIGRTLNIQISGIRKSYNVTAILHDLPADSSIRAQILIATTPAIENTERAYTYWGSNAGQTYLRFASPQDARFVEANLGSFVQRRAAGTADQQLGPKPLEFMSLSLVSLPDIHFHDVSVIAAVPGVDRRVVYSLGSIGLIALIIAAINYVNLATATSVLRAREVAIRKVMGAARSALLYQFIGEAAILVTASAFLVLALAELALHAVNAALGVDLYMTYTQVVPMLIGLIVVVTFGAGFYPAILLARYQPADVLAASRTPAGTKLGGRLRNLLVVLQFASAIGFAICTLVIDVEAAYLSHADRGFEPSRLIVVSSLRAAELATRQISLLEAWRHLPGVTAVTLSDREPNSDDSNVVDVRRPGSENEPVHFVREIVGNDYMAAYGVHLLAGRWFDPGHGLDDYGGHLSGERTANVVINRRAAAALGFKDPADAPGGSFQVDTGAGFVPVKIIGIVEDVRFMSPREPVLAQFYLYRTQAIEGGEAAIRFEAMPSKAALDALHAVWRGQVPDYPFIATTAEARLSEFYHADQQRARLFSISAVLAVAIACFGLFGLASFSTERRLREIGIRKVLGASSRDVLFLLVEQFVRPVLIANVIAWPVAWYAMASWLAGFDQRIALSPLYFLGTSAAALAIAVLTVIGQASRIAAAEPAAALRYE